MGGKNSKGYRNSMRRQKTIESNEELQMEIKNPIKFCKYNTMIIFPLISL